MSSANAFLYFAYGSNLKLSEIRDTCPSAERMFRALLPDHRLVFPRRSAKRHCGVAGIEPQPGPIVWGGVYRIIASERVDLDRREGFQFSRPKERNSYVPAEIVVFEAGDPSKPRSVLTYFANREPAPPLPSDYYKSLIVDGSIQWELDAEYVDTLRAIPTLES